MPGVTRSAISAPTALWVHRLSWLLGGLLVLQLLSLSGPVLNGVLPGNDDQMRLQQVRDLLSGQSWFDVSQTRFLSPESGAMHWSRVPDIFLLALILIFALVLSPGAAESVALIIWPVLLFSVLLAVLARAAHRLGSGGIGVLLVFFLTAQSASILGYHPGRIDHHGLVLVLVMTGFAALLSPSSSLRSGLVLAFVITAMLSVALEGMIYAATLAGLLGLIWCARGHVEAPRLVLCGLGLVLFAPLFYTLDAPGPGPDRMVCDAYGTAHLRALVAAGIAFIGLGLVGGRLAYWQSRLSFGLGALAIVFLIFWMAPPGCFSDPYDSLSNHVRETWLSAVGEAQGLIALIVERPRLAIISFGFLAACLCAAVALVWTASVDFMTSRLCLLCLLCVGVLISSWQFRGVMFAAAFGAMAAGGWLSQSLQAWRASQARYQAVLVLAGALLLMPSSWALIGKWAIADLPERLSSRCRAPILFQGLPKTEVLDLVSPIDLGPSILIHTPHRIFAAPYHRNNEGLGIVVDLFLMPPEEALSMLRELGADGLLYCPGLPETQRYARLAPNGLAARLERGDLPGGLAPSTIPQSALQLYTLRPDPQH